MNRYFAIGVPMVAGALLGAAAVQTLHAQATPPAYVVAEINVTDQNGYMKEFVPLAAKSIQDAGGKYLARAGKTIPGGGTPPQRIVILQFESLAKAQQWFSSRKDFLEVSNKYSTFRDFAVEGVSP